MKVKNCTLRPFLLFFVLTGTILFMNYPDVDFLTCTPVVFGRVDSIR